jgi:hypothetical protein
LSRAQFESALTGFFGKSLVSLEYYRWPTGIDGWLEDAVVRVRVTNAARAPIFSGDSLVRSDAPLEIVDRLSALHRLQYQTLDGFSLVKIKPDASTSVIGDLKVDHTEVAAWLADKKPSWKSVLSKGDPKTTKSLLLEKTPGVYSRNEGLVALVVPALSKLSDLEGPFRTFAFASDLLLGAVRIPGGGMLLVGRARQAPFSLLPPLRFETFASFARSRTDQLAQSYERQRIFAGRIRTGKHRGWDWAPILLSAQLDDTEYGTLLNLADQILKSWSQHGDVDYYAFGYEKPKGDDYPFGEDAASEYFKDEFLTTSLLFNWNTEHFTDIAPTDSGDLLAPDRTGALSILYRPSASLLAEALTDPKEREELHREIEMRADDKADEARDYFATRGDPILVRVVQNTILAQSVQNFLRVADPQLPAKESRSDKVAAVLQKEALDWLTKATRIPADPAIDPEVRAAVAAFIKTSSLMLPQLAKFIASPQVAQQDLLRDDKAYDVILDKIGGLRKKILPLLFEAKPEFESACGTLGGTLTPTDTGERCNWKEQKTYFTSPAFSKYNELEASIKSGEAQIKTLDDEANKLLLRMQDKEKAYGAAEKLSHTLAEHASATDLDAVLTAVLSSTARTETAGSIRTPSVVLSRNTIDVFSVGGHNIGLTVPKSTLAGPIRLTVPGPKGDLPVPPPPRPIPEALAVKPRTGTLLDEMRSLAAATEARPERLVRAAESAKSCACDALVIQHDDGTISFIKNSPPPAQIPLFGKSGLAEVLPRPPATVVYENFSPETVDAIVKSTTLDSKIPRGSGIDGNIRRLASVFNAEGEPRITVTIERKGRTPELLKIQGETEALGPKTLVSWKGGVVEPTSPAGWAERFGPDALLDPARHDALTVRYPKTAAEPESYLGIRVEMAPAQRRGIADRLLGVYRAWNAPQIVPSPWSHGIVDLRNAINTQLKPMEVEFFYSRNAGKIRAAQLHLPNALRGL